LIEKPNIKDKVELILERGYFILKPISQPRKGWDTAFKEVYLIVFEKTVAFAS